MMVPCFHAVAGCVPGPVSLFPFLRFLLDHLLLNYSYRPGNGFESRREISRLTDEQAQSIARENGEKIRNWLNEAMDAARTLAHVNGRV
jgi:hypothetical protein